MDIFAKNQDFLFGESYYPDGGEYGPVYHSHLGITYVKQGNVSIEIDGVLFDVQQDHIFLTLNRHSLDIKLPKGIQTHTFWCDTYGFFGPEESFEKIQALPKILKPSDIFISLIKLGVRLGYSKQSNLMRVRNSLGETVYNEYFRLAHLSNEDKPFPDSVIRIKQFIENNYSEPCRLQDIADNVNLHPNYLLRVYKKFTGNTPMQYIWQLRGEKAINLLSRSGLNVAEIAFQCGFKNPYHFSTFIKKHYGCTPSEFRKQKWSWENSKAKTRDDEKVY